MLVTQIAQQACVSPATVSRAINQPHRVGPASLARVRAVLHQHNFSPRPHPERRGRRSESRATKRIGVWFVGAKRNDASLGWFQDELLRAQAADERYRVDLRLLFSTTTDHLPAGLRHENVDGLIVQGLEPAPPAVARMQAWPHVWFMTRRSPAFPGDYVEPNNEENGALAAQYLHEQGHRSVAVITADPDYSALGRRVSAFSDRARALGMTVCTILGRANPGVGYLQILPLHAESESLARRLLDCPAAPTGLYLPSDHFCGSFFRALREAGRTPGRDFEAVIGNYNPVVYHNLDHSPAVIDINLPTLVRNVIDHLFWRIDNPAVGGRVGVSISPTLRRAEDSNSA